MWKIAFLFIFSLILHVSSQHLNSQIDCTKLPTTLWCQNEELARKCNFTSHCHRYKRATNGSKIQLTVLFSSLCWYSQKFIKEVLYPKIYANFSDYVNIELIPFGNANRTSDGKIQCKRGIEECKAHLFITCAQRYMNDSIPLVYCLESDLKQSVKTETVVRKCYEKLGINENVRKQIETCSGGEEGRRLQQIDADRTENAWPDWAEEIPWILFNNVSLAGLQENKIDLKVVLCNFYLSDKKLEICNQ